jgi:hypothetical protein
MKNTRPRGCALIVTLLAFLLTDRAMAQAPLEPAQLPPRTSFYMVWRGAPAQDVRSANSLLALWDDPDFAPVRSAMFENMMRSSEKDSSKPSLTREEIEQYSSLIENAFVVGYVPKPEAKMTVSAVPPKPATAEHPWNGMFLVYNRTGKEALLSKAVLRMRGQEKETPQISQLTVAGVPVLKVERKDNLTYWVEHGKYAASAGERSVLEEILARLESTTPAPTSLAQSAAYQEARPLLSGGLIEFFARIPNLKTLAPDTGASGFQLAPVLDAMKLDAVHSFCGRLSLDGSKTHVQAALLGDAAPGTLFDLWSEAQKTPASLSLLPSTAVSYSETQLNLPAFYELLRRAVTAALPPGQQGTPNMLEGLAQNRIGMPIQEGLGLLSGEFASMQTSPVVDPQKAVYFIGIRKKPETLKLIRSIFGDQVTSERNEGDTTFLKISLGGGQGTAGVAQWHFYHLAVTPDFILGAGRSETLRELLASRGQSSMPAGGSTAEQLQAARAGYPEKLDGLNFFDFQKVDWPALKARWVEEAKKASETRSLAARQQPISAKVPDLLTGINPEVFPRHLHFMSGATWKDAKGIHFDERLE